MNYKKIIKSRETRERILRILKFVPDRLMLKIQYRIYMGRNLNLDAPERYTEKIQWYKVNYRNPVLIQCVDKFDVRDYIKNKELEYILNDCYGVFDDEKEVDFLSLPDAFVIKDTLGSGGNSVMLVRDKSEMDEVSVREIMRQWTRTPLVRDGGREWPYYSGKHHRILIEKYIKNTDWSDLLDYKFFCFSGKVEFVYVMGNRKVGQSVSVSIVDREFNLMPVTRQGDPLLESVTKPDNFEGMVQIAEQLAKDFPHVRVDLYDVNGDIIFGELTFYNASGYMKYNPDEFDFDIGAKFIISQNIRKKHQPEGIIHK